MITPLQPADLLLVSNLLLFPVTLRVQPIASALPLGVRVLSDLINDSLTML